MNKPDGTPRKLSDIQTAAGRMDSDISLNDGLVETIRWFARKLQTGRMNLYNNEGTTIHKFTDLLKKFIRNLHEVKK